MTKEEAAKLLPIIKAYSEGKTVEYRCKGLGNEEWKELIAKKEIPGHSFNSYEYRIKPKPKYRPFKDAEECWNEMQKHQPFGWVKQVDKDEIKYTIYCNVDNLSDFEADFDDYKFADGTPFGIKEE